MIKYILLLLVLVAGCGADYGSKQWARTTLPGQPIMTLIPGCLEVGYSANNGMVFGIMNNSGNRTGRGVLVVVRIIILIGVLVYLFLQRREPWTTLLPLVLIVSGAGGNVLDNLRFGHVIDFIHIHAGTLLDWPFFFNLADVYLCLGMGWLLWQGFFVARRKPATA